LKKLCPAWSIALRRPPNPWNASSGPERKLAPTKAIPVAGSKRTRVRTASPVSGRTSTIAVRPVGSSVATVSFTPPSWRRVVERTSVREYVAPAENSTSGLPVTAGACSYWVIDTVPTVKVIGA
jgi:hypothetical protein